MIKGIKNIVYLAILTTVVVASWIGFSVHHSYTTSTIGSDTKIRITPIAPQFDKTTVERLRAKKVINVDLNQKRIIVSVTPEITKPVATPSGELGL